MNQRVEVKCKTCRFRSNTCTRFMVVEPSLSARFRSEGGLFLVLVYKKMVFVGVCVCAWERERERERERARDIESDTFFIINSCFFKKYFTKCISNIEFYVFFSSIFWLYLICDFVVHQAYHVYTDRHVHIPVFQKHEGHEKWPCTWKVGNEKQH